MTVRGKAVTRVEAAMKALEKRLIRLVNFILNGRRRGGVAVVCY